MNKILPRRISSAISVSLGAMIATLPFTIAYFNKISLLALVTNFVVLPVATVAYMLLFVFTIFALIIPFAKYLYVVVDYMIRFVTLLVKSVASQTKLIVYIKTSLAANVLFYSGLIIASDFILIKKKWIYYVPVFLFVVAIILSVL